jgi:hypothetical protein
VRPEAPNDVGTEVGLAPSGEGRIARSWRLTRVALRVVRRDRSMFVLALLGTLAGLIAAVLIFKFGGYYHHDPSRSRGRLALVALIAAWPTTFVSVFFNVALAAAADAAMNGRRLGLRAALAVSVRRLGQILLWSLLAAGVGVLLRELAERIPWGGRIASWLLGAAWGLLTIFAVPVLAIEGCSAPGCLRRSAELLKSRWGEATAGGLTITAWAGVAGILPALMLGAGVALLPFATAPGIALLLTGLVLLMVVGGFSGAVRQVFAVALYHYAADGTARGGFPEAALAHPFSAKKKRRGLFRRRR